jgi:hypothetical protein
MRTISYAWKNAALRWQSLSKVKCFKFAQHFIRLNNKNFMFWKFLKSSKFLKIVILFFFEKYTFSHIYEKL